MDNVFKNHSHFKKTQHFILAVHNPFKWLQTTIHGLFFFKALDCLPPTPWEIPRAEFDDRKDFRDACVFSIDPLTARDLDDALSCEDLGNGRRLRLLLD